MSDQIHITPGPILTLAETRDDRPTRWCFHCRKHVPHTWKLIGDPSASYYEPVPLLRCSRCNSDCASFPGTYIDGPRYPGEEVARRLSRQLLKDDRG